MLQDVDDELKVLAPSPKTGELIEFEIEAEIVRRLAKLRLKTPLFELFYNVCGMVPPVNNIGYHEKEKGQPQFEDSWGGLKHTHTIFCGIKRPLKSEGLDEKVFIYISSQRYRYKQVPDMVCSAKRFDAPVRAVFAAYIVFDDGALLKGRVLNWDWVRADSVEPHLPDNHRERYDQRVWGNWNG